MRRLLAIALLAAGTLALGTPAAAQFTQLPNTGCGNSVSIITWAGSGQIGTRIDVKSGCSSVAEIPTLLIGGPNFSLPFGQPIACVTLCTLELFPWMSAPAQGGSAPVSFMIPSDPNLIGAILRFQGACLDTSLTCVTLTAAVELTVN